MEPLSDKTSFSLARSAVIKCASGTRLCGCNYPFDKITVGLDATNHSACWPDRVTQSRGRCLYSRTVIVNTCAHFAAGNKRRACRKVLYLYLKGMCTGEKKGTFMFGEVWVCEWENYLKRDRGKIYLELRVSH